MDSNRELIYNVDRDARGSSRRASNTAAARNPGGVSTRRAFLLLILIFLLSLSALAYVYTKFPKLDK